MEKSNISESKIARRTPIIKYSRILVPRPRTPRKMILSELLRDTQRDFSRRGLHFALSLLKYLGISALNSSENQSVERERAATRLLSCFRSSHSGYYCGGCYAKGICWNYVCWDFNFTVIRNLLFDSVLTYKSIYYTLRNLKTFVYINEVKRAAKTKMDLKF